MTPQEQVKVESLAEAAAHVVVEIAAVFKETTSANRQDLLKRAILDFASAWESAQDDSNPNRSE